MKIRMVICGVILLGSVVSRAEEQRFCPYNIETGEYLDVENIPSDQLAKAYDKYLKDLKANPKKYISKPCPQRAETTSQDSKKQKIEIKDKNSVVD